MASPFRVFRKNVKPLLVVFGCLLILAWVGGSSLTTIMGPRGGGDEADSNRQASAVAASWEGGNVTNQDLYNLVMRRTVLRAFLDYVEGLGRRPADEAGTEPSPLRVVPLRLAESPEQGVEQSVVQTKLFADAAREAGMDVDDKAIVQYLAELGRDRVTTDDIRRIVEGLQANNPRVSIDYVFDALRDELLARNFLMSNMYAVQTVTPQQRWQDWLRVNDRVVIEAAAIPVESYLNKVKPPTDAEVQAFYDEFKTNEAGPDRVGDMELSSARPGFRVPRKIDIQFVQANFNDLVTKTEGEITDEEIAKYYEDNKGQFIKADTGIFDDEPASPETPPVEAPATNAAPTGENDAPNADSQESEKTDADDETDAEPASENPATTESAPDGAPDGQVEPQTPSEPPTSPEPPTTTEPTDDTVPAETPPAADESSEPATPGDADQSTRERSSQSVFRQVAFLQEQETEGSDAESTAAAAEESDTSSSEDSAAPVAAETPAAETAPSESAAPAAEAAAAEDPAPTSDATATPDAPPADPATTSEAPASSDPAATPASPPPAAEKPIEYQPLEEVRDEIRLQLARERANDTIGALMDEVLSELTKEFNSYFDRVLSAKSSEAKRPAPQAALADLAQLAEKHGLNVGKTGAVPWLEFRETPVGKSIDPDTGAPLSAVLYARNDRELYQPILTVNVADGDRYITMKSSDTPSRVPTLDEVRPQVVQAWKRKKAAEIALKEAEKQAADAQKKGSSLVDFYAEKPAVQVERIDPFSYLTRGDVPDQFGQQRFRFSQPDGIVAVGPALLQRVFELKDGEVGAVLNHDHSIAYVIRVVEHQDSPDTLRTAYLAEANTWDGLSAMTESHVNRARGSIVADIAGSKGVDWKRDPDKVRDDADTVE